ncbi:MAG TPA: preprotein translocase subunit SecE [Candidatus Dormibacteraeota bacterium]
MAVRARQRTEGPSEFPITRFAREVYDELRKVVWPTPPELYRYTVVVVVTVIILATFVGGVDFGVSQLVKRYVYSAVTKGT